MGSSDLRSAGTNTHAPSHPRHIHTHTFRSHYVTVPFALHTDPGRTHISRVQTRARPSSHPQRTAEHTTPPHTHTPALPRESMHEKVCLHTGPVLRNGCGQIGTVDTATHRTDTLRRKLTPTTEPSRAGGIIPESGRSRDRGPTGAGSGKAWVQLQRGDGCSQPVCPLAFWMSFIFEQI